MEYQCVSARFLFYNGQKHYTVEYTYGGCTWYVFEDEKEIDSVFQKRINPTNHKSPNRIEAETILYEYLDTITA